MVLHFTDLWGELSKRDRKVLLLAESLWYEPITSLFFPFQDFESIEQLMINEGLYQETLEHIPGNPRIPYLYVTLPP